MYSQSIKHVSLYGPNQHNNTGKRLKNPDIDKVEIYINNENESKLLSGDNRLFLNLKNINPRDYTIDLHFKSINKIDGRTYKKFVSDIKYNKNMIVFEINPIYAINPTELYNMSYDDNQNNIIWLDKTYSLDLLNITKFKFKVYFTEIGCKKIERFLVD